MKDCCDWGAYCVDSLGILAGRPGKSVGFRNRPRQSERLADGPDRRENITCTEGQSNCQGPSGGKRENRKQASVGARCQQKGDAQDLTGQFMKCVKPRISPMIE